MTIKAAERLWARTLTSQYRKILKHMVKAADDNKSSYMVPLTVSEYTLGLLKQEGFVVDVVKYSGYDTYRVSWAPEPAE